MNTGKPVAQKKKTLRQMRAYSQLYLMALPGVLVILIFKYIPIFGWRMAFTNYELGLSIWDAPWAGLKYFKEFLIDSGEALPVIRNTLVMNVSSLILGLFTALVFAILLKEARGKYFKKIVQSATFFPYFLSWVMLYAVVYSLFSNSSGAVNETLIKMGVIDESINLLGDPKYSWTLIICVNLWNGLGYNSVIFIAAIASIPGEQFEAAEIDGASRFQRICYITVPNLVPTLMVLLIMNMGWIFNSGLDQFFVFTNSMNISTMEVFDYYIYRYGLKLFNYSYATAAGIVQTFVSLCLIVTVNYLSKKYSERALF